jgi:NIMA (never in mitosis gene a)-related kinase
VLKIRSKSKNQFCACKEIEYGTMSEKEKTLLVSEVNILRELRFCFFLRNCDLSLDTLIL